jgi:hypothetical protein
MDLLKLILEDIRRHPWHVTGFTVGALLGYFFL